MSFPELIPSAYAQAAGGQPAGAADMLQSFAPLIIIGFIFYFLLFRPQQQRQKQLRQQLSQIRRGDSVVTAGGILGTVSRVVNDDEVLVEIAEGVRVRVVRSTITSVVARGEPVSDNAKNANADPVDAKPAAKRGKAQAEG